jgi:hypothetical protein
MPAGTAIEPLHFNESWFVKDARPKNAVCEAAFDAICREAEGADLVFLHSIGDEPFALLSPVMWRRVLATVCVSSGEPVPEA